MGGVVLGDRVIEWGGEAIFTDSQNNLTCSISLDSNNNIFGKSQSDDIKGVIEEIKVKCVLLFRWSKYILIS